jgi:hypothetical protein
MENGTPTTYSPEDERSVIVQLTEKEKLKKKPNPF